MSRGTRSRTQLPGTARDYIMAPTTESPAPSTTTETAPNTTTPEEAMQAMAVQQAQLKQMMDNMNKDPVQQMQMMMMQTNQLQQQMGSMMQINQNMMNLNMNKESRPRMEMKLQNCPIRKKSTSLEAWIKEVEMWDEAQKGEGLAKTKYLNFMENVRKSECDELKKFVDTNIVENLEMVKDSEDNIKTFLRMIFENLAKSDLEKSTEAWTKMMNIKQKENESPKEFVMRFEQAETELKNVGIKLPQKALAIHILQKSNISEMSKENIVMKADTEDHEKIFSSISKCMREIKTLTVNKDDKRDVNKTFFTEKHQEGPRRERSRFNNRSNSRSKRDGRESYRSKSRSRFNNKGRDGSSRRSYRERDNSRSRGGPNFKRDSFRGRERGQDGSRSRRGKASSEVINHVHFSEYNLSKNLDNSELELNLTKLEEELKQKLDNENPEVPEDLKSKVIEDIFNEGNTNNDPFECIVDPGCPKTVAGKKWMDSFAETKGEGTMIKRKYEDENFKFGPSKVYNSNQSHEIEVEVGNLKTRINVSVVNADIPLLLGLDYQEEWGIVMDIEKRELHIKESNETFNIKNSKSTHWKLPIQNKKSIAKETETLVFNVELKELSNSDMRKHITKVHKNLAHKSQEQMTTLFRLAGKADTRTKQIIKDVVDTCTLCKQFKKTPPRPKVAMPKATTNNEVVSLDLKEKRKENKHILYCIDEFSGYVVAEVVNDKKPDTIIEAFNRRWVEEGPGIPRKGVFSDNGGEFKNPAMKEMAAKFGIKLFLTAGNSPWSNGKNERNHFTCDKTIDKLMEDDESLKLEDAVRKAVYVHNLQVTRRGFSPRQIVFGHQGVVPGISEGTPASMEPVEESDVFRKEFVNRQKTETEYRKVDANERIQKVLAQQTYGYADIAYSVGDLVFFLEDGKSKWSGPGKVTGVEGSKVRLIHSGYDRTVPNCRVIPATSERTVIDNDEETKDDETKDEETMSVETKDDEPHTEEEEEEVAIDFEEPNIRTRPKRNEFVKYEVDGHIKYGKVVKVGKQKGKDKNRCWIRTSDEEENVDFLKDVANWKVVKKRVQFDKDTSEKESNIATNEKEDETIGVWWLRNQKNIEEPTEDDGTNEENEVFATNVPTRFHKEPEVVLAKEKEIEKWIQYEAFEEVDEDETLHVLSSRWVVTEKENSDVKARLCVRGFEEDVYPQSDSPTAHQDSFKLFLAIAANEGFKLKGLDVTSAFLQGEPLERDVFMEPPKEAKVEGKVWKLMKSAYGLYDASRKWFLAVKAEVLGIGMKPVSGDEAVFHMIKDGILIGLCLLHVDDFLVGGSPEFHKLLGRRLQGRFTFGKIEEQKFKFTGLNIEQTKEGIYVDQIDFIEALEPITTKRVANKDEKLNAKEFKSYRGITGQLAWAASNTRPDLANDVRELATKNKNATFADIKIANKILKKAKSKEVKIKYSKLGKWNKLKIVSFTDSSYRNAEETTKSVGGRALFLVNAKGDSSPLNWKSKTIQQVCKSVKSAETRSLELGCEDSVFISRMFHEICSGEIGGQIDVNMKIDSRTLLDSLKSTKQVEEKTMRHIVAWMKQQLEAKTVSKVDWVCSEDMLADVFTKTNVKTDDIIEAVTKGKLVRL